MIKAKKSLGQNFLIDDDVINKIVNTCNIFNKTVLEIGPGTGNLTRAILQKKPKKLFVIEKDSSLCDLLEKKFKDKIKIYNSDVLNFDEKSLTNEKITIFGNLPYNISTEILCKWIVNLRDDYFWFDQLTLMFQKEVANRIIANFNSSNYGRLSILSNWKLNIVKICDISSNSFLPKPKVDSSLLFFTPKKITIKLMIQKIWKKLVEFFLIKEEK